MKDNKTAHRAIEYDEKINITIPYYDKFHTETIDIIKTLNDSAKTWLDTGCGTGNLVIKAAESFPNTQFTLADPSKNMLDIAKEKLLEHSISCFKILEHVSTQKIDISSNYFDVITAIQSHHYLDADMRKKATENCYRMLKPKGAYITFENVMPSSGVATKAGLDRWRRFQIRGGKSIQEAEDHIKRFGKEYFPITITEHIKLLNAVGFETVEIFWVSYMQAGFYAIKG